MESYTYLVALHLKKRNVNINLLVNSTLQKMDEGSHMANVIIVFTKHSFFTPKIAVFYTSVMEVSTTLLYVVHH